MFGVLRPGSPERDQIPISPNSSPPPPRSLAPMPASEFRNREDLLAGCKDWAASQGYAVVIARSRFNRLWLKCDRGGNYENRRNLTPDQRKRKRGESRLLGCPFKMLATCKKDGIWRVDTDNPEHNHGPSEDLSAHPTLRRMTDEQVKKVHDMCDAGKSPAETLDELKATWPDIKVLTRDIYNARKKYKTEKELAEATAGMQAEQQWQDPNELGLPGPNPNGRWAWVPDGEEVTNKKSKKKRKPGLISHSPPQPAPAPPAQSTLDPQLQTPNPHSLHQPMSAPGQQLLDEFNRNPQLPYDRYDPPDTLQHHVPDNGTGDPAGFYQPTPDDTPQYPPPSYPTPQPNASPSRLRSQRPPVPTATMSTSQAAVDMNAGTPKAPSGQVLMSRIERMEKEQRDQKNMLAQILGAVQSMHSSPGSV